MKWFLQYQKRGLTHTISDKFKDTSVETGDHWKWLCLTKGHSCGCFLLNQRPPSSKSPLNAWYYHIHFAWIFCRHISAHFSWTPGWQDLCWLPLWRWCAVTRLVIFACAQHLQTRFCSQVGEYKPLLLYNEIQVVFKVFTKLYLNALKSQEL